MPLVAHQSDCLEAVGNEVFTHRLSRAGADFVSEDVRRVRVQVSCSVRLRTVGDVSCMDVITDLSYGGIEVFDSS